MKNFTLQIKNLYTWILMYITILVLFLIYCLIFKPIPTTENQLLELKVKIIGSEKLDGGRDSNRFLLYTSQYKCLFAVEKSIKRELTDDVINQKPDVILKIKLDEKYNLNLSKKVIKLYFLKIDNWGLIFDENETNQNIDNEFFQNIFGSLGFMTLIFLLGLFRYEKGIT
jgi:hypothetical protein